MKQKSKFTLSIIIPIGPFEENWKFLLSDLLSDGTNEFEIIFSAIKPAPPDLKRKLINDNQNSKVTFKWVQGPQGRARQLNLGANIATGDYLWFLHADTRLGTEGLVSTFINKLKKADPHNPHLYFFDLRFLPDGPPLMPINEIGTWVRSHYLKLPFGDQGPSLKRDLFWRLGGYREDVQYGEDHLFVWAAHQAKVPLVPIGLTLFTSARRYKDQGWLRTTFYHLWLTLRQAVPEASKVILKTLKEV